MSEEERQARANGCERREYCLVRPHIISEPMRKEYCDTPLCADCVYRQGIHASNLGSRVALAVSGLV